MSFNHCFLLLSLRYMKIINVAVDLVVILLLPRTEIQGVQGAMAPSKVSVVAAV